MMRRLRAFIHQGGAIDSAAPADCPIASPVEPLMRAEPDGDVTLDFMVAPERFF